MSGMEVFSGKFWTTTSIHCLCWHNVISGWCFDSCSSTLFHNAIEVRDRHLCTAWLLFSDRYLWIASKFGLWAFKQAFWAAIAIYCNTNSTSHIIKSLNLVHSHVWLLEVLYMKLFIVLVVDNSDSWIWIKINDSAVFEPGHIAGWMSTI